MCDNNNIPGHTFKYSSGKVCNVVQDNSNVIDFKNAPAVRTNACRMPQPQSKNNINANYRCDMPAWDPAQKRNQQQTQSNKMRQSERLRNSRSGRTVYYSR